MVADAHRALLGAALVCLAAGTATAQRPPEPAIFGADVTLIAVPVFVTDRSGRSVPGLTAEEFDIEENGRRVAITAFHAVDVDAPAAPTDAELPVAVQAAASRQFLLLFDLQFSSPAGVSRARAAATRFVRESLGPRDLVAVATFGRAGLRMLTGFTSDHSYIARAVEGLGIVEALALTSDPLGLSGEFELPTSRTDNERAALAEQELAAQIGFLREDLRRGYATRVVDFLGSVKELVRSLAVLRGRKQVVLLSGGFAESAWQPQRGMAPDPRDWTIRKLMQELFEIAGDCDVVIHSIDLGGLEGPVDVASWDGSNPARATGRGALTALAANTGGRSVQPTNDFARALGEMDSISRTYYVLAFEPADQGKPGRRRSLDVRVRRSGLSVSHRRAYVLPKRSEPDLAADRLAAAEAIAKGLSGTGSSLSVLAIAQRGLDGAVSLPTVLHIDGKTLAAAAKGERLGIQVFGYAMAAGRVLDSLTLETTLDLTKLGERLSRDGLRLLTVFVVPDETVEIRFFARAAGSIELGSIRHAVTAADDSGALLLSPAMAMLPLVERIAMPVATRRGATLEIPFRLGNEPFVPAAVSLQPGRPTELCVFVRRAAPGPGEALDVSGELVRDRADPVPVRLDGSPRIVDDHDGFDRYVFSLAAPLAPAGEYTLRLTFRDTTSGLTGRSETKAELHP
jgi:VWFA-related protein